MTLKDHKLTEADYVHSPNQSGGINPRFIVMHYTAGWTADSAVSVLTRKGSGVSAHITLGTDGKIYQHVPFNRKAWHAGPSSHMGYHGLNSHSIGIEIVNPGYQRKVGDDKYQDAYGTIRTGDKIGDMVASPHARVGGGTFYWPVYTPKQLEALRSITKELVSNYDIIDIVSHEEIDTRGWKTDPGPAFPMKMFKQFLATDRGSDSERYAITATSLNVRGGPGSSYGVIGKLNKGDIVEIEGTSAGWGRIDADGWIHMGYVQRV